ncbi:hypothetical protein PFHG_02210 [Plasmodium falciparum HB3]|uniref:Palmitoyltransferase n=1 Tax=Plasmodium falciparum (isolate HB3) TaxID=137071 RepID=A0A0L7KAP1_PLAFX|nr:hypothetical protein PFHG_02210 [Plasmodium falciparum HB3]
MPSFYIGYVTTCPTNYIETDQNIQLKNFVKQKKYNNTKEDHNNNNLKYDTYNKLSYFSTNDSGTSCSFFSSSTSECSTDELRSLTILHHKKKNTIITERYITSSLNKETDENTQNVDTNIINIKKFNKLNMFKINITKNHIVVLYKKKVPYYKPLYLRNINYIFINSNGKLKYTKKRTPNMFISNNNIKLNKINKHDIIFYKNIKEKEKNKNNHIFYLYRNKLYQYNIPLPYCKICDVYQILRSKHCQMCKRCVRTFDHHCPWINNCVAENNRSFFLLYLYFELFTIWCSIKFISHVVYLTLYDDNGMDKKAREYAQDALKFIPRSGSNFLACKNLKERLENNGFINLSEGETWNLNKNEGYVLCKENRNIWGFFVGKNFIIDTGSILISIGHIDSCALKYHQ